MSYQPPLTHPVFFNGTALNTENWQTGTNGVAITRIEGWFDAPDVRDVRELNSGRDGELAENLYLGGRTITIQGVVSGSTYADLQTKKTALTAKLVPSSSEYVLKLPLPSNASPSWTHADTMTDFERVNARVIEGVQFGDNDGPLLQEWVVTLRASDPLVYSDTLTTVDSGTSGTAARTAAVTNSGTYASPGDIVVTGPTAASWDVSDDDGDTVLAFDSLALAASSYSTINLNRRTVQTVQPYKETRLSLGGTYALWMLNETSGTTADNAEGTAARDGTYTGGYTLNQAGPAAGLASVDLNGTTGYVSIAYSAGLYWADAYADLIFEFWVYPDAISGTQTIFDSVSGNTGLRLQINSSGQLVETYGRSGATKTNTYASAVFTAGQWNHLTIYITQTGRIVTLNSFPVSTSFSKLGGAPNGIDPPTATGMRFGSTLAGASFLNGKIGPVLYMVNPTTYFQTLQVLSTSITNSGTINSFANLNFESAQWSNVETGSSTYTLRSPGGLNTGSKLSIQYRSARL